MEARTPVTPQAMDTPQPVVEARGLCFTYPGCDPEHQAALREVSFATRQGTVLCLAGANGSGKSTLLSLLAGLASPTGGELLVRGHRAPGAERAIRRGTALCLQEPDVQILGPTPREDLLLCLRGRDAANMPRVTTMARRFELEHCLDAPVHTLSHGQKRKLCLATALLSQEERCHISDKGQEEPAILLLDEPCSGLDFPAIREMRAILADNKARGLTQVLTTHDLEPLLDVTDQLGLMVRGRLVHRGPPLEVLSHARECGVRPPCGWRVGAPLPVWE